MNMQSHQEEERKILGAMVAVLNIKPGSLVRLTLGVNHKWSLGRIQKLAAAIRKAGGELTVLQQGTTLRTILGAQSAAYKGTTTNAST